MTSERQPTVKGPWKSAISCDGWAGGCFPKRSESQRRLLTCFLVLVIFRSCRASCAADDDDLAVDCAKIGDGALAHRAQCHPRRISDAWNIITMKKIPLVILFRKAASCYRKNQSGRRFGLNCLATKRFLKLCSLGEGWRRGVESSRRVSIRLYLPSKSGGLKRAGFGIQLNFT